jgi:hypothetical protein
MHTIHREKQNTHKFFQNRKSAPFARRCIQIRVMVQAERCVRVPVVWHLLVKYHITVVTSEVLEVVFAIEGIDISSAQCSTACETTQIKSSEVVQFTQWIFVRGQIGDWKESEAIIMYVSYCDESRDLVEVRTLKQQSCHNPTTLVSPRQSRLDQG